MKFAHRDAEAFANFLRSPAGGGLDNDHLKILTNEHATAGRVAEALDGLIEQAKEGDEVIIYFSGHGDVEGKKISQPGLLLCWDAPSRVYMGGGTYSLSFLQEVVTTLSVQIKAKVFVVTDACHAGKLAGSQIGGAQLTAANLAKQYANEVKILSCQPGEFSLEGEQWGGGRGAFSYHLVDGLYGLADRNADGQVTVGEIDRYLEDKVTAEAAPQSQVPMLLGNKTERLATVNAAILADLKKLKLAGLPVFAATEGRGIEDDVLAKVDSSVRQMYFAFKKAVSEKRFFPVPTRVGEPGDDCAETYYAQLSQDPSLARLHGMMKRNYAAALQDDAQQYINAFMKSDWKKLECVGFKAPDTRAITKAIELLGTGHYLYKPLLSLKFVLAAKQFRRTESNRDSVFKFLHTARTLTPESAYPAFVLFSYYGFTYPNLDSAEWYFNETQQLAPAWILPFTYYSEAILQNFQDYPRSKLLLDQAMLLDSTNAYVWSALAYWFNRQGQREEALASMARYEKYGGELYPCFLGRKGVALFELGRLEESELLFRQAIQMDSTKEDFYGYLARIKERQGKMEEAEAWHLKAISINPFNLSPRSNLGVFYRKTGNYPKAVEIFKAQTEEVPTYGQGWVYLGSVYYLMNRREDARMAFQKGYALAPTSPSYQITRGVYFWLSQMDFEDGNFDSAYRYLEEGLKSGYEFHRITEPKFWQPVLTSDEGRALMKKYFPDKVKD